MQAPLRNIPAPVRSWQCAPLQHETPSGEVPITQLLGRQQRHPPFGEVGGSDVRLRRMPA